MKKWLFCFLMVLIVFSATATSAEKLVFGVSFEKTNWEAETGEISFMFQNSPWWYEKLILPQSVIKQHSSRLIFSVNYSPLNWLTLSSFAGTEQSRVGFGDLNFIQESGGFEYGPWQYDVLFKTILQETNLGFLYGGGLNMNFPVGEMIEIFVKGHYLHIEQKPLSVVLYDNYSYGYTDYAECIWYEKVVTEKIRSREIETQAGVKIKTKRLSVSIGPILFLHRSKFSGISMSEFEYTDFYKVQDSYKESQEFAFEFTARNASILGGFAEANCSLTPDACISIKMYTGAKNGLTVNLKIRT